MFWLPFSWFSWTFKNDFLWVFCLHVWMCILYMPSSFEREGISWNWSERWLRSTVWVMKLSVGPPQKSTSALNCWALSPALANDFFFPKRTQPFKNQEHYYVCSSFYYKNNLWWIVTLKNILLLSWGWPRLIILLQLSAGITGLCHHTLQNCSFWT